MYKKRKPSFRKCVISSCGTTSININCGRLIKFPSYGTDKFYDWITYTKVQLLEGDHYICSRHFLNKYLGSNGNHLCRNAIPTENLDYVKEPKPLTIRKYDKKTPKQINFGNAIEIG